ncbi:flavin reductase family protein [Urechidicola vernalis]|uniref:Flavin reductase n=1 Tax=Urechidicola vernalis TaxID=3075600 RepID=A0ABU2Y1B8_9FLAO|nr:flavin reductase [Urechidicola sp. P050]MDT0551978.1 flavin reductase [Urechidicola sp. P050]
MVYLKHEIEELPRVKKLKLINALSGIKPANLIGTVSEKGIPNLAIFSSVFHLGSNPALMGFIVRPTSEAPRHTYANICKTEYFTINHVNSSFYRNAHYTSAKFPESISEFDSCGLTESYEANFLAPFVKESSFKIGLKFEERIEIKKNNTILVIGEVHYINIPDQFDNNEIDLSEINGVGISGLNSYYELKLLDRLPYARVHEVPNFNLENI